MEPPKMEPYNMADLRAAKLRLENERRKKAGLPPVRQSLK